MVCNGKINTKKLMTNQKHGVSILSSIHLCETLKTFENPVPARYTRQAGSFTVQTITNCWSDT